MRSYFSAPIPSFNHSPWMKPGQTAFTRISGPSARASDRVIVTMAPFDAAYAIELPTPITAAIDATLTMLPRPPRFIAGRTARVI